MADVLNILPHETVYPALSIQCIMVADDQAMQGSRASATME